MMEGVPLLSLTNSEALVSRSERGVRGEMTHASTHGGWSVGSVISFTTAADYRLSVSPSTHRDQVGPILKLDAC